MELENRMISAERLKSKCYEICDEYNMERLHIDRIIDEIDNAPDVEVVHGRWVRKAHDGAFGVFHLWHCSVCDTIRARQDPYCGECGAKMDGGADNG